MHNNVRLETRILNEFDTPDNDRMKKAFFKKTQTKDENLHAPGSRVPVQPAVGQSTCTVTKESSYSK